MTDNIKHAGIKGMKWRNRKGEEEDIYDPKAAAKIKERQINQRHKARRDAIEAKKGNSNPKKSNSDPKKVAEARKKKINEMSDGEVARAAKRLELKKKYREVKANKAKRDKGKKAADNVISTISTIPKTSPAVSALSDIGSTYYKRISAHLAMT